MEILIVFVVELSQIMDSLISFSGTLYILEQMVHLCSSEPSQPIISRQRFQRLHRLKLAADDYALDG